MTREGYTRGLGYVNVQYMRTASQTHRLQTNAHASNLPGIKVHLGMDVLSCRSMND